MCHQGNQESLRTTARKAPVALKLGHLGFAHVTKLGKVSFLDRLPLVSSLKVINPLIVQLVILPDKQRKPSGHKHVTVDESKVGGLTKTLNPGDLVFMDHLESKTRGRLGHTSGPREKLTSSVEVWSSDAASHYIHVEHQVSHCQ
jgi:hypothetical protein